MRVTGDTTPVADQRAALGLVAVKCPKCGTESVLDSKRPAKPAAKCGASVGGDLKPCGEPLTLKE